MFVLRKLNTFKVILVYKIFRFHFLCLGVVLRVENAFRSGCCILAKVCVVFSLIKIFVCVSVCDVNECAYCVFSRLQNWG